MAMALVASTHSGLIVSPGTSRSLTIPAPANGNTLVCFWSFIGTTDGVTSITQTGATWAKADDHTSGRNISIWVAKNVSGAGTSVTLNFNTSLVGGCGFSVLEFSGVSASADITSFVNSANGNSTTIDAGSVTPTASREVLLVAAMRSGGTPSAGPTNSFTGFQTDAAGGGNAGWGAYRIVSSSSGSYSTSWTQTSNVWAASLVAITNPAATGANPVLTFSFPANNSWKDYQGNPTVMTASATDAEDGTLAGSAISWSSNLDGSLGTGLTKAMTSLSTGTHTITATATDSNGNTHSVQRTVTIGAAKGAAAQFITRRVSVPASAALLIDGQERYFQVFIPKDTAVTAMGAGWSTTSYRTLTCYPGSGEMGNDNVAQMTAGGSLPQNLGYSSTPSTSWPTLVICLQQPNGTTTGSDPANAAWYDSRAHFTQAIAAEDAVAAEFPCDSSRRYYTGYSQGAVRAWEQMALYSSRYAAFISMAGCLSTGLELAARITVSPLTTAQAALVGAPLVKSIPLKMLNSSSDATVTPTDYNETKNALVAQGLVAANFFIDTTGGHSNVWTVGNADLVNPAGALGLRTWLFSQALSVDPNPTPPATSNRRRRIRRVSARLAA